jgi:hypothetical protein
VPAAIAQVAVGHGEAASHGSGQDDYGLRTGPMA